MLFRVLPCPRVQAWQQLPRVSKRSSSSPSLLRSSTEWSSRVICLLEASEPKKESPNSSLTKRASTFERPLSTKPSSLPTPSMGFLWMSSPMSKLTWLPFNVSKLSHLHPMRFPTCSTPGSHPHFKSPHSLGINSKPSLLELYPP